MIALLVATVAGYGVHLHYTAVCFGWRGAAPGPRSGRGAPRRRPTHRRASQWLTQAGLGTIAPGQFLASLGALFALGATAGALLFAGALPALACGAMSASLPIAAYRQRRLHRVELARDAWPRLIDELRILTGRAGRSIPQALFEVGSHAPTELRPAFEAARREWLVTTDFARTLDVLKTGLADPTADATCETLLIAHEVGGSDLDLRLEALAEDRRQDAQGRKDARAEQAGVRFARRFVLIVPLGMALVGLSIGNGRSAYASALGQAVVVTALALVLACWVWSGRVMRLPTEARVFP